MNTLDKDLANQPPPEPSPDLGAAVGVQEEQYGIRNRDNLLLRKIQMMRQQSGPLKIPGSSRPYSHPSALTPRFCSYPLPLHTRSSRVRELSEGGDGSSWGRFSAAQFGDWAPGHRMGMAGLGVKQTSKKGLFFLSTSTSRLPCLLQSAPTPHCLFHGPETVCRIETPQAPVQA